ncbi:hypothetical protein ABW19_dt0208223 [Dactylella cylindrospora]|nr:hypothetical protein ABW19_dt0208223 [Dactylella cylindrospora]
MSTQSSSTTTTPSTSSRRRRSTSSVFSSLAHLIPPPPLPRWNPPPPPPPRPPVSTFNTTTNRDSSNDDDNDDYDDDDSPALAREVQQEALKLNDTDAEAAEAREREELAEILSQDDWAPSEASLFTRLRRRGREPLLPAPWRLDFATFPEVLYAPVGETSFICALTPTMEFRGRGHIFLPTS